MSNSNFISDLYKSFSNFQLEVVSHLPEFKSRVLNKYWTNDGIETVGVFGNEPFEIRFKNNTYQKVQVKLSLDGTDVQTGKPANTSIEKAGMWVVQANSSMTLTAWPETNKGGAQFVFTTDDNSVAFHTHGDMSSKGIIAAAVYTEENKPTRIGFQDYYFHNSGFNPSAGGGQRYGSSSSYNSDGRTLGARRESAIRSKSLSESTTKGASVGAGQYVEQNVTTATGLVSPILENIVKLRYMWWTELKEELNKQALVNKNNESLGFPGDKEIKKMADLGSTPRIETAARQVQVPSQVFERLR